MARSALKRLWDGEWLGLRVCPYQTVETPSATRGYRLHFRPHWGSRESTRIHEDVCVSTKANIVEDMNFDGTEYRKPVKEYFLGHPDNKAAAHVGEKRFGPKSDDTVKHVPLKNSSTRNSNAAEIEVDTHVSTYFSREVRPSSVLSGPPHTRRTSSVTHLC